jgi:hypothetical protein
VLTCTLKETPPSNSSIVCISLLMATHDESKTPTSDRCFSDPPVKEESVHPSGAGVTLGLHAAVRLLSDVMRVVHAASFIETSEKPAPGPLAIASHVNAPSVVASVAVKTTAAEAVRSGRVGACMHEQQGWRDGL